MERQTVKKPTTQFTKKSLHAALLAHSAPCRQLLSALQRSHLPVQPKTENAKNRNKNTAQLHAIQPFYRNRFLNLPQPACTLNNRLHSNTHNASVLARKGCSTQRQRYGRRCVALRFGALLLGAVCLFIISIYHFFEFIVGLVYSLQNHPALPLG